MQQQVNPIVLIALAFYQCLTRVYSFPRHFDRRYLQAFVNALRRQPTVFALLLDLLILSLVHLRLLVV